MDIITPAVAGLLAGTIVGCLQLRRIVEPGQGLWAEWSAWALLVLFSIWKQWKSKPNDSVYEKGAYWNGQATTSDGQLQHGKFSVKLIAGIAFSLAQLAWVRNGESIWWATVSHPIWSRQLYATAQFRD